MRRFSFLVLLLALIGTGAFYGEQRNFLAPGPPAHAGKGTIVWIKSRESAAAIAQQLQSAGVLRNALLFRLGVRLRGNNAELKAGEYAIPSAASMADVMGILIEGKSIQHKITAAEGLTSRMVYELVRKNPILIGDAGSEPAEGTLLPETFHFVRGTTRAQMLERMARAQRQLLRKLWLERAPALPFKSPQEAVTLASIVEKETAIPEERRHIAAVFINRLRLGMKLQSDPTIIYGITKGYPLGRGIRQSELAAATPYNTYVIFGLPPTPICNPGKESLAAVLRPETSDDLYFVANGAGGHVFTSSALEHRRNVIKWRRIEQSGQVQSTEGQGKPTAGGVPALRATDEDDSAAAPPEIAQHTSNASPRAAVHRSSSRHRRIYHRRRRS